MELKVVVGSGGLSGNNGGNTQVSGVYNSIMFVVSGGYSGNNIPTVVKNSMIPNNIINISQNSLTLQPTSTPTITPSTDYFVNFIGSSIGSMYSTSTVSDNANNVGRSINPKIIAQIINIININI